MKNHFIIIALILCASVPMFGQTSTPNADDVMATMFARDSQREALAAGYSGSREYLFDNTKLGKHAQMQVVHHVRSGRKQALSGCFRGWLEVGS